MTDREQQIMELLRQDPMLPQGEIARRLGITRSSVGVHLANLSKKGDILGKGYVLASVGQESGEIPYTAYFANNSYIEKNPEVIQKFTNALQKGMDFVQSHTPEEIAKVIAPQFKETDLATITTIVSRYYEQDTWKSDLIFNEESFNLLQDILENSGELKERVPYEELVTTTFAEKAAH